MKHTIRFIRGFHTAEVLAETGRTIVEVLESAGLGSVETPCGGNGLCGKCRFRLVEGGLSSPSPAETELLSDAERASGLRLACQARVEGDAVIELPEQGEARFVTEGPQRGFDLDPPVQVLRIELDEPRIGAGNDDESRLVTAVARAAVRRSDRAAELERDIEIQEPSFTSSPVALSVLSDLAKLERGTASVDAIISGQRIVGLRPADGRVLGLGVDIGTTSIACRLVDLQTGEALGTEAQLNGQRRFGADVISRIAAASSGAFRELRDTVRTQVSEMARSLAQSADSSIDRIVSMVLAGNTTMLHLFAGLPPDAIAASPFVPVFLGGREIDATELGLAEHSGCQIRFLPGLSAYVGADIVAGMAAIGLDRLSGRALYLDLGTNGEIACGGSDGIVTCSAAAGPAFEGGGIEMGVVGSVGAIDSVWIENGDIRVGTIGGTAPNGICGSGLIDALAVLLDTGLMDSSGRIIDEDEAARLSPGLASRISRDERGSLVFLDDERNVYLSQVDIRAAQLAKAAIAAGIETIIAEGPRPERVYLAGGFGSLVNPRSAARIGLIPRHLAEKAIAVGNSALAGAVSVVLSRGALESCERIRSLSKYVELSSSSLFTAAYVEHMAFPERP